MFYVVVDIGGTNTTIGLIKVVQKTALHPIFELITHKGYKSKEIKGLEPALLDALQYFKQTYQIQDIPPINISACGPTDGLTCHPTNLPAKEWFIDKRKIEKMFHTKVFLINDFSAIAYSLMTIHDSNDSRIVHIDPSPHTQFSSQLSNIRVVLGAGTGLGCATIHAERGHASLISSEGGWADFTPTPRNFHEMKYLYFLSSLDPDGTDSNTPRPYIYSWEDAICASRGINNIYTFFCDEQYSTSIISKEERTFLQKELASTPITDRPSLISTLARKGEGSCLAIIKFWISLYAKYAKHVSCFTLPYGGVFIGGGAAAKNLAYFLENDLFYTQFNVNLNKSIEMLFNKIPLYIIQEYLISLYGNAYHLHTKIALTR